MLIAQASITDGRQAAAVSDGMPHKSNEKNLAETPERAEGGGKDSEPDIIKVMGDMGFMVYGWFTGSTKLEVDKGMSVTTLKDGTRITHFRDGSMVTERRDGSRVTELRDGVTITSYPDGTTSTDYKDGTVSTKYKDGTAVIASKDGTTIATYPDGTTVTSHHAGTIVTTYKNGTRILRMPDGTTITEKPNGDKITEFPDGTRTVEHKGVPEKEHQGLESRARGGAIKGRKSGTIGPASLLFPPATRYYRSGQAEDMIKNALAGRSIDSLRTRENIHLPLGHMLICPSKKTKVAMVEGDTSLAAGTLALCGETGADGAILNFLDARAGGVRVNVCGKLLSLPAGKEMVMTRKLNADFEDVNPFPEIPYRHVRSYNAGDGIKIFICEFSIPEAIRRIEPIKRLCRSSEPSDRKLAHKLMKTAAALTVLRRSGTPFRATPKATSASPVS